MSNNILKKWSDLRGLVVYVPKEGKSLGTVEDLYFKEGTNEVYSLLVRTRVLGDYSLPVRAIKTIEAGKVTIDNENMLIKALPPLPRVHTLVGRKVVGENGTQVGTVGEVWLGTVPAIALRISAIGLTSPSGQGHAKSFTADAVESITDDVITIHDQNAKNLR